jgi:hypothetical protein
MSALTSPISGLWKRTGWSRYFWAILGPEKGSRRICGRSADTWGENDSFRLTSLFARDSWEGYRDFHSVHFYYAPYPPERFVTVIARRYDSDVCVVSSPP